MPMLRVPGKEKSKKFGKNKPAAGGSFIRKPFPFGFQLTEQYCADPLLAEQEADYPEVYGFLTDHFIGKPPRLF